MARNATITINQRKQDLDYKKMIQELIEHDVPNNPYHDRSESDVVKMILKDELKKRHGEICRNS
jgi:hypothetical protein